MQVVVGGLRMAPSLLSGSSLKCSLNLHIKIDIQLTKTSTLAICGLWKLALPQLEFAPFLSISLAGWLALQTSPLTLESCSSLH